MKEEEDVLRIAPGVWLLAPRPRSTVLKWMTEATAVVNTSVSEVRAHATTHTHAVSCECTDTAPSPRRPTLSTTRPHTEDTHTCARAGHVRCPHGGDGAQGTRSRPCERWQQDTSHWRGARRFSPFWRSPGLCIVVVSVSQLLASQAGLAGRQFDSVGGGIEACRAVLTEDEQTALLVDRAAAIIVDRFVHTRLFQLLTCPGSSCALMTVI